MAHYNSFRSLKNLSLASIVGLALMGVTDLISAAIGAGQIASPESSFDLAEDGPLSIWLTLQGLVYLLKFPIYTFTVAVFLMWLHRAHSNLNALQARNLQFTPGWAVGWWFIPFANLVKPFQAVREVWWESDPETAESDPVFLTESLRSAPTYMGFWWGTWLLSNFAANVSSLVYDPETMANIEIGGMLFVIAGILSVASAILAIMVVKDISDRQAKRLVNLNERYEINSPPRPPVFDRDL